MGESFHGTTILCVRRDGRTAMGGDGQVSFGDTAVKHGARKVRRLYGDRILAGFAGSAADAFALLERFEGKLDEHSGNLLRSATELAKEWRTDRVLRRLESLLIVADAERSFLLSGQGDAIEPDDGAVGIGSGGAYARAAALALLSATDLPAEEIVRRSMEIAGVICVYTNDRISIETL